MEIFLSRLKVQTRIDNLLTLMAALVCGASTIVLSTVFINFAVFEVVIKIYLKQLLTTGRNASNFLFVFLQMIDKCYP